MSLPSSPLGQGSGLPQKPLPVQPVSADVELTDFEPAPTPVAVSAPSGGVFFTDSAEPMPFGEESSTAGGVKMILSHGKNVDITANYGMFDAQTITAWEQLLSQIANDESSEVLLNGPNEIFFKMSGNRYELPVSFGTIENYHNMLNYLLLPLTDTHARLGNGLVLIEGQLDYDDGDDNLLPLNARVTILGPPASPAATVSIAKKARRSMTLGDIVSNGALTPQMGEFLRALTRARVTMVLSGTSGAGKTTLLEALTHEFDDSDRVGVIEDVRELSLTTQDTVYLQALSSQPGVEQKDEVSLDFLVRQAMRHRFSRIVVGEIRGAEMGGFLIAANSGADGSMTTLHATSPREALEKILRLASKDEFSKNEDSIRREIASTVQLIIQMSLIEDRHVITHIEEVTKTVTASTGTIQTNPIYEYDRSHKRHYFRNRPTDALVEYMKNRGVNILDEWFH